MTLPTYQPSLDEVKHIVQQCDRCGTCLTVCPLFQAKDIESSSARGKNNLARGLLQGVVEPTTAVRKALDFCLLCRSCVDNCPNKVPTDDAMILLRQHFADATGTPGGKYKALGTLLKTKSLVKFSAGALKVVRVLGLNSLVPHGMAPQEFTRAQYLASFAGPAALGSAKAYAPVQLNAKTRVAYFKSCGLRMMFPDAVAESLRVLGSVSTPLILDNRCCGLPHLAHGQQADFLAMAKENIALFEQADVVVSDCASCSGTLKHLAKYLADDPAWASRAEAFSKKVMSFSEYLCAAGYQPRQQLDATLTFHEPCHLGRGQGVKKQPRQLLKATGNYVEMTGSNTCCGGAGSFHTDYPDIANSILQQKKVHIENSGAQVVVTECPTCLIQLNKLASQSGGKFKAMHISQVI
ncbi:MAG: (Fe-S)-binding protein [Anaeromusa sp.]|uniref:(Fe-S)-binding protein n=1 Tax=Anaeromusa sp. TaxID=1872520 RepID=UPI002B1F5C59|nr:(Fe-S)-binding protein [Anaeromusa sp.]MEA4836129.1 (Fe-S)-binding protein [Anaeromusa sp.]